MPTTEAVRERRGRRRHRGTRGGVREDRRNSDGHSDSPSGGLTELGPSLGQPFGRHSRIAPRALRSKLRPLYRVAHIWCHLSGRASPSRTSSCRNPDSLLALRNYFAGRERRSQIIAWHLYVRRDEFWAAPSTSIYRRRRGGGAEISATSIHVISKIFWSKNPK